MNKNALRLSVLLAMAVPGMASAQITSGWFTGTFQYYEHNGNYCDDAGQNQDCTDAFYRAAHVGTNRAMQNAVVNVFGFINAQWTVVGTGRTDANGTFLIAWNASAQPSNMMVFVYADDASGRFRIRTTTGDLYGLIGAFAVPEAGHTNSSNPQSFSANPMVWGNAGNPSAAANIYGMAKIMADSLSSNGLLDLTFVDVEIRALYSVGQAGPLGVCNTACANFVGSQAYIQLPEGAEYKPQARILHEMGHIASSLMNNRRQIADYCWPDAKKAGACSDNAADGGNADGTTEPVGWSFRPAYPTALYRDSGGEWGNSAFEEGFATFLGDRAIYRQGNPQPVSCNSGAACNISDTWQQLERNTNYGVTTTCSALDSALRRSPFITDRYLRDVYDASNDSAGCTAGIPSCQRTSSFNDTVARTFAEMLSVIYQFPNGLGNNQNEEPYDAAGHIDDRNGFRAGDYVEVYRYTATPAIDTTEARSYNCLIM